jgi:hypothetical protein
MENLPNDNFLYLKNTEKNLYSFSKNNIANILYKIDIENDLIIEKKYYKNDTISI